MRELKAGFDSGLLCRQVRRMTLMMKTLTLHMAPLLKVRMEMTVKVMEIVIVKRICVGSFAKKESIMQGAVKRVLPLNELR